MLPFDFGDFEVYAGDSVQANCIVRKGDHPLTFHWKFNGSLLQSSNSLSIQNLGQKMSVVSIMNVNEHHQGVYTCEVYNAAGSDSYDAELKVKGRRRKNMNFS